MAIQSFIIDPEAGPMSGDEIITAINTDSATVINKANVVAAIARPIEVEEVGTPELAANAVSNAKLVVTAAKDNLDAMADVDRRYVQTNPTSGECPVIGIDRTADGRLEVDYDDVPIP